MAGHELDGDAVRTIRDAIRWSVPVADRDFDRLYPERIRAMSVVHWTPVAIALRAARWLAPERGMRVLDVGAGAGKLCCIGALSTEARWVGVERDATLVNAADVVARRLALGDRVQFTCGDMATVEWKDFDSLYFYNPFEMIVFGAIPAELPHRWTLFGNEIERVCSALADLPSETRIVTYLGYGGDMPSGYALIEAQRVAGGQLALWIKRTKRRSNLARRFGVST